jgi:hypothetical protein
VIEHNPILATSEHRISGVRHVCCASHGLRAPRSSAPGLPPRTALAPMDTGFWTNLPAPRTPVNAIQIDPDFSENLYYRLSQLREQTVARCQLLDAEVLEYRLGHTPPGLCRQDERQIHANEYIKHLEPATPSTPATSASLVDPSPRSDSRSLSEHTNETLSDQSPVAFQKHGITPPSSIDEKRKRKHNSEECDDLHHRSKR